jgi:hypothetical protein
MSMPVGRATALFVQSCLASGAEPAGPSYGERARVRDLEAAVAAGGRVDLPRVIRGKGVRRG